MIFAVTSKVSAKLVKKISLYARDNAKYEIFKHSSANKSKANSSDSLAY